MRAHDDSIEGFYCARSVSGLPRLLKRRDKCDVFRFIKMKYTDAGQV